MAFLRLVLVGSILLIPCAHAAACRDAAVLRYCSGTSSFDAGECATVRDTCGCWMAQCAPDAGPPDAALPPMCSNFRDTGVDGPTGTRNVCTTTAECAEVHPELVCGSDGFCECAPPGPPPGSSGCSVGHGASTPFATLGATLVALATLIVSRRSRAL